MKQHLKPALSELSNRMVRAGVLQQGHFVLRSKHHSAHYISMLGIITNDHELFDEIIWLLVEEFVKLQITETPTFLSVGTGTFFAHKFAQCMNRPFAHAKWNEQGTLVLPYDQPGFQKGLLSGDVYLFDDVVATGHSFQALDQLVSRHGGKTIGATGIINRGMPGQKQIDVSGKRQIPLQVLFDSFPYGNAEPLPLWSGRKECPLCIQGVPYSTAVGKGGDEFLLHGQPIK